MATKSVYHISREMGDFEGKNFYTKKEDLKSDDKVYVISSKGRAADLTPYLEGCYRVVSVNEGVHDKEGREFRYSSLLSPICKPKEPIDISQIRNELGKQRFASRFMNQVKPSLSQHEIERFESLLGNASLSEVESEKLAEATAYTELLYHDLQNILQSDTERAQSVMARIGQGKFRANVAAAWGLEKEVCVLTGIAIPSILTASHIVPWSECVEEKAAMRWDGANGVLLCAHLDRLFDRYYFSFKRKGRSCAIEYSDALSDADKQQLGLTRDLELVPNQMSEVDRDRLFGYLEEHHSRFIELEAERSG